MGTKCPDFTHNLFCIVQTTYHPDSEIQPPQSSPRRHGVGRWILRIFVVGLLLLFVAAALLYVPAIQRRLKESVVAWLNDSMSPFQYSVGEVHLTFPLRLSISDVVAYKAPNDTLFSLGRLETGLSDISILQGDYEFGRLYIEGLQMQMETFSDSLLGYGRVDDILLTSVVFNPFAHRLHIGDVVLSVPAVDMQIHKTPSETNEKTHSESWQIEVERLRLEDTSFSISIPHDTFSLSCGVPLIETTGFAMMTRPVWFQLDELLLSEASSSINLNARPVLRNRDSSPLFDYAHLDLHAMMMQISNLFYEKNKMVASMDHFAVKDSLSGLDVSRLRCSFQMDTTLISLQELELLMGESSLQGNASIDYALFSAPYEGSISMDIEGRFVREEVVRQLSPYFPHLSARWPDASCLFSLQGDFNHHSFDIKNVDLAVPNHFRFHADADGESPFDKDLRRMDSRIQAEFLSADFLLTAFAPSFQHKDYTLPDSSTVQMRLECADETFYAEGDILRQGNPVVDLIIEYDRRAEKYRLHSDFSNFSPISFFPSVPLSDLDAQLHIEGVKRDVLYSGAKVDANLTIDSVQYLSSSHKPLLISDAALKVHLSDGEYQVDLQSNDTLCRMSGEWKGVLRVDTFSTVANLRVEHLDLSLFPTQVPTRGALSFQTGMFIQYDMLQRGDLHLSIDRIAHGAADGNVTHLPDVKGTILARPDYLSLTLNGGDCQMTWQSDCSADRLPEVFGALKYEVDRQIEGWMCDVSRFEQTLPSMDLRLDMGQYNPFYPFVSYLGHDFSYLGVRLHHKERMIASLSVDDYEGISYDFDTIRFSLQPSDTIPSGYDYTAHLVSTAPQLKKSYSVGVAGQLLTDSLTTRFCYNNRLRGLLYDIGASLAIAPDTLSIHLLPNPVVYAQKLSVNPDNFVRFDSFGQILESGLGCVADVHMTGPQGMSIHLHTAPLPEIGGNRIEFNARHLDLDYIGKTVKWGLPVTGRMDVQCLADVDPDSIACRVRMNADSFTMGSYTTDSLTAQGRFSHYADRTSATLGTMIDGKRVALFSVVDDSRGATFGADSLQLSRMTRLYRSRFSEADKVLAMLRLEAFPLPMLNAFMPKEFLCNGTISGRVDFNGDDIEHLDGVGFVCADSASLYYSEADATIHLSSDTLWLQDNVMQLDDYALHATGENPLRVNGVIDLRKGLPKARADLRMQGNNVWVIRNDKRARTNQMLAGSLPLDVDLRLSGPFTDLGLTGSVSALNATDLNFYMKASPLSAGAKTDQLVEFVSFDKMNRRNIAQIFAPRPILKEGFHADIRLNIASNATLYAALSPDESDRVSVTGGGALQLQLPTSGDMKLNGSYEASGGVFTFKLPMLPMSKSFDISDGGRVVWNGQVTNPELNLTATEEVRCTINDETGTSRVVKFIVFVKIGGTVNEMTIHFDCAAPEDASIQNQINSLTEEERSKQALHLLVSQTYSGPGISTASSMASANAALNALLQKEVEAFLNQRFKNTEVAVGIDTYDATGTGASRTDYSVKISQRLLNDRMRLVVGGRVSSGDDEVVKQDNAIINDFSLEWLLREDGSRYLRLFRKTNYESILEGEIVETGVGYVVQRSAYRFKDLIDPNAERRRALMLRKMREMDVERDSTQTISPNETP